jgi:shikimate 5-dehydrogenase
MDVTIYNRTPSKGRELARRFGARAEPLAALSSFDGEIVVNTIPGSAGVIPPLRPGMAYVEAAYGGPKKSFPGVDYVDGLALLRAQAVRQNELFVKVFE